MRADLGDARVTGDWTDDVVPIGTHAIHCTYYALPEKRTVVVMMAIDFMV